METPKPLWGSPGAENWPLFSFAVKPLYIGHALRHGPPELIQLYSAIQRYTALYIIQRYIAIHHTASTTPLWQKSAIVEQS